MHLTTHKKIAATVAAVGLLAAPAAVQANPANSVQPAHVYFGTIQSGSHPNRLVTLHNGTGAPETIQTVAIGGSGGYVFTLAANTTLLAGQPYPRCKAGLVLAPGARCAIDVRVHTLRAGWWRSVLRVVSSTGWFNSSELRAHVVAAAATAARSTKPGNCTTIASASQECSQA